VIITNRKRFNYYYHCAYLLKMVLFADCTESPFMPKDPLREARASLQALRASATWRERDREEEGQGVREFKSRVTHWELGGRVTHRGERVTE
jgi:hypothetical protein